MSKGLPRSLSRATVDGGLRPQLSENLVLYVDPAGSDAGSGGAEDPFLTPQRALDVFQQLDLNGFSGTVQLADGTYTSGVSVTRAFIGGVVTLLGDAASPEDVILSVASGNAVLVQNPGSRLLVSGISVAAAAGSGLAAQYGGQIDVVGSIEFGVCGGLAQMSSEYNSLLNVTANYNISASSNIHKHASYGSTIRTPNRTVTITNTPAFATQYASASSCAQIQAGGMTFVGSATGKRYNVIQNGFIGVSGAAATYFPGDVAGTSTLQGLYN